MARREEQKEVRRHISARARELSELSWEELDRLGKRTEQFTTRSQRTYRVVVNAFWDMGPEHRWETDVQVAVAAYAPSGWHSWWPFRANAVRPGPPDVPKPPGPR